MIAPVLARLDAIPGVASARADGSCTFLLLELEPGANVSRVEAAALRALDGRARRLGDEEAAAQVAARPRGDLWFSAAEAPGLSYLECRILSVRLSGEVARGLSLGAADAARLAEAIREVLFGAVERIHAEGGRGSSGWFFEAWPELARRVAGRFPAGLPGAGGEALAAALLRQFPGPGGPSASAGAPARLADNRQEEP